MILTTGHWIESWAQAPWVPQLARPRYFWVWSGCHPEPQPWALADRVAPNVACK